MRRKQLTDKWKYKSVSLRTFDNYAKTFQELNKKYKDNDKIIFSDIRKVFFKIKNKLFIDSMHYTDKGNHPVFRQFIGTLTAKEREVFRFPPASDPYYTLQTLEALAKQYPGWNVSEYS